MSEFPNQEGELEGDAFAQRGEAELVKTETGGGQACRN